MTAYYNEIDPYCAQWLRNLIVAGHIAPGDVDERSIEDVRPDDLRGYTQCHFFAGVGVWSSALRLAGWPDDRPVWTGSCPCQPFSAAGKGTGFADERHLWPAWCWLIGERRPPIIFGEQVASSAVDAWIDLVHADLEAVGYAFGSVPFPSAGVGAPHIRDRNYWVADAQGNGYERRRKLSESAGRDGAAHGGGARLEERECVGRVQRTALGACEREAVECSSDVSGLADASRQGVRAEGLGEAGATPGGVQGEAREWERLRIDPGAGSALAAGMGDATGERCGEKGQFSPGPPQRTADASADGRAGPTNGFWRAADWLYCRDGKWRPVEPGTFPLAHGATARVGRLRAYGNAINRYAAAAFIESAIEAIEATA